MRFLLSCLVLLFALPLLAVLLVLLPLGSFLSLGQTATVGLLLVAVVWTTRAAWDEVGPLNLVLTAGEHEHVWAGLPTTGSEPCWVALDLRSSPPTLSALPGPPEDKALALKIQQKPRRQLAIEAWKSGNQLWNRTDVRIGRSVELGETVRLLSGVEGTLSLRILDR